MICEYCNTNFSTISSLNLHKKKAKYCLKIQSDIGIKNTESNIFKCNICSKELTNKNNLIYHLENICVKDYLKINNILEEKNILLEKLINEHYGICKEKEINDKLKEKEEELKKQFSEEKEEMKIQLENKKSKYINNKILILNDIQIIVREDGYINLTQLCKAGNKEFSNWLKNKNTEAYLMVLSSSLRIRRDNLIKYETGSNENRATWGHPQAAINIAQWISPQFDVQVSKWIFELNVTGKVEFGNEKSNKELENLYQEKINLQNRLKNYETTIFNRNIDYCPIEYYGKDIVYFIKFNVPINLHSEYVTKYPNIDNKYYNCIEFGVSSDFEKRLSSHKRDKKKDNIIFLHAIEIKNRYTSSKMEFYIKRIAEQLNIKFKYEKKKECILVNEENFNILVNRIITGLNNIENYVEEESDIEEENETEEHDIDYYDKNEIIKYKYNIEKEIEIKKLYTDIEIKKLDNEKEMEKEKEKISSEIVIKKIEMITDLFKNNIITLEDFKNMFSELK